MENRKFNIEFIGIEWFIEVFNFKNKQTEKLDIISPITSVKNGEILQLFDIFTPSDKHINSCKKYKEFNEICEFYHDKHSFVGTFIDALNFIKVNFKEQING